MMKRKYGLVKYIVIVCLFLLPIYFYTQTSMTRSRLAIERNVDHHHRDTNLLYWNQLSDLSITRYTAGWKDFIEKEKKKPIPTWQELYGIVFVAGNDDTLKRTMGTIRLLQETFHCTLPIEIWHMEHEADIALSFEKEINSFQNVQLRDLSDLGLVKSISRRRNLGKQ